MVRCQEFYEEFEKKGNFCNKSDVVVKNVERYIEYMKRNKFGDFIISNCAIEPFIRIENLKDGKVHKFALKELRKKIKKIGAKGVTRRISIEIINYANNIVNDIYKLDSIPNVRSRMGEFEHEIGEISYETREAFNVFKEFVGIKSNNEAISVLLVYCKNVKVSDFLKAYEKEIEVVKEK